MTNAATVTRKVKKALAAADIAGLTVRSSYCANDVWQVLVFTGGPSAENLETLGQAEAVVRAAFSNVQKVRISDTGFASVSFPPAGPETAVNPTTPG